MVEFSNKPYATPKFTKVGGIQHVCLKLIGSMNFFLVLNI